MKKRKIKYIIICFLLCFTTILGSKIIATEYNGHEIKTYYANYCTWYACGRVWEVLGVDIDKRWGNACNWTESAQNAGYIVDYTPAKNTIAVWSANNVYTAGHVAFVEEIDGNNMTISEYNYSVSMGYSNTTISTTDNRVYGAPPMFIHFGEEFEQEYTFIKGDINKDKHINATDAAFILDLFKNGGATEDIYEIGDMNDDNVINSADAAIILDIFKNT